MERGRSAGCGGNKKNVAAPSASAPSWKKSSGANLSAKAKKEYLKWKREQKRNQAEDDSDGDWAQEAAETQPAVTATASKSKVAGCRATDTRCPGSGAENRNRQQPSSQQQRPQPQQHHHQHHHQAAAGWKGAACRDVGRPGGSDDGAEEGGCPVPPAPPDDGGLMPSATQHRQLQGGGGGGGCARAIPDDRPLIYQPMVELPAGDVPESVRSVCGDEVEVMRLPRLQEDEVGFTAEGRRLGMPKRPPWRGVVRNADQLHRLEERSFQAWVNHMYESVDSPSRISFFESKLDFWRQLWRVLERSDVAIMIVDARNPLLHFSEALANHIMDDHGIPALLVLNKCDLVPASCVEQWRRFFEQRYPGLKVVASSASAAKGKEAAEAIMDAVLNCVVARDGQRIKVSEVVQMNRDEILATSKARNTHSKRDRPQAPPSLQNQQQQQVAEAADDEVAEAGPETGEEEGEGGERGGVMDSGWELKGIKAKKKEAVRRKRSQRMHGGAGGDGGKGGGGGDVGAADDHAGDYSAARKKMSGFRSNTAAALQPSSATATEQCGRSTSRVKSDQQQQQEEEEDVASNFNSAGDTEDEEEEDEDDDHGDDSDDSDNNNDNSAFDQLGADEDEEGFLSDNGGSVGTGGEGGADDDENVASASGGVEGWGGHGARGGSDRRGRSRPVVVCVVGEPNVGKSSTLNALLGAKRVAVSTHPGRTKHYQTHVMCSGLMLCDCPGLVFPRLDVSLHMQVLFGSYPIARCRDPYAVVRYLAERVWPRLHRTLGLGPVAESGGEGDCKGSSGGNNSAGRQSEQQKHPTHQAWRDDFWTPLALCEALAARHNWRSRRGGRLDVYRAANSILRSALAGRNGVSLAFLPPEGASASTAARGEEGGCDASTRMSNGATSA